MNLNPPSQPPIASRSSLLLSSSKWMLPVVIVTAFLFGLFIQSFCFGLDASSCPKGTPFSDAIIPITYLAILLSAIYIIVVSIYLTKDLPAAILQTFVMVVFWSLVLIAVVLLWSRLGEGVSAQINSYMNSSFYIIQPPY